MKSEELFNEALKLFPMGVNSPVRYYSPVPVMFSQGKGSKIMDVDGNEYIDYSLGFGPMILRHANDNVISKIKDQLDKGILFGSITENEIELGKIIKNSIKITGCAMNTVVQCMVTGNATVMNTDAMEDIR